MNSHLSSLSMSISYLDRELRKLKEAQNDEVEFTLSCLDCDIGIWSDLEDESKGLAGRTRFRDSSSGTIKNTLWHETFLSVFDALLKLSRGETEAEAHFVATMTSIAFSAKNSDIVISVEDEDGYLHTLGVFSISDIGRVVFDSYRLGLEALLRCRPEIENTMIIASLERKCRDLDLRT